MTRRERFWQHKGLLKKAVSGVLAIFLCSRITHTLRTQMAAALLNELF